MQGVRAKEKMQLLFFIETYGKWQVESVDRVLAETDESLLIHRSLDQGIGLADERDPVLATKRTSDERTSMISFDVSTRLVFERREFDRLDANLFHCSSLSMPTLSYRNHVDKDHAKEDYH